MLSVRTGRQRRSVERELGPDGVDVHLAHGLDCQCTVGGLDVQDVVDLLIGRHEAVEVPARLEDAGQYLLVGEPRAVLVGVLHGVAVVPATDVVQVVGREDHDVAGPATVDLDGVLALVGLHDEEVADEQAGERVALLLGDGLGIAVRAAPGVLVGEREQIRSAHRDAGDDRTVTREGREQRTERGGATDGPPVLVDEHQVLATAEQHDVVVGRFGDERRLEGVLDHLGLRGERTGRAVTTKEGEQRHDARFLSIEGHCWLVVGSKTAKQCSLIPDYKSHSG